MSTLEELQITSFLKMYLVINQTIFYIPLFFSPDYLCNFSPSGIDVFGYIDEI